ncbi:MAG: HAMP domain-containing protein [Gemmatimonadaceae bacterium]|nr:HAMP domain-containing protein [Gemmatimonadaceae bacterium]
MRSLRARIFVTVWPLFVAAILGVGVLSSRSARIELAQFEQREPAAPRERPVSPIGARVAAGWATVRRPEGAALLERLAREVGDSIHLLVVDTAGAFVASSDTSLASSHIAMQANGGLDLTRTRASGRERLMQRLLLHGDPVVTADDVTVGSLYVVPSALPPPSGAQVMVAGIQRSLWSAVLLACVLAAVGTWLLAYPLVAQVQRLTAAAVSVQEKALSTRVRVSSRDEMGALEQSFNRMAASLEQTEVAKRQLISDLAHELRTPLTNVIGLIEAMRDGLRTPDARTLASTQEEALLLQQLIDELQELALADAGALRFDIGTLDAGREAERAVAAFQAAAPRIVLDLPNAPVPVRADARRVAQVLRNVLQNAGGDDDRGHGSRHSRIATAADLGAILSRRSVSRSHHRGHGARPRALEAHGGGDGRNDRRVKRGRRGDDDDGAIAAWRRCDHERAVGARLSSRRTSQVPTPRERRAPGRSAHQIEATRASAMSRELHASRHRDIGS